MQVRRYIVKGKVQGVGFRFATQKAGNRLGLRGNVRNLPDGSVEVRVGGAEGPMREFLQWLHQGPMFARVSEVEEVAADEVSADALEEPFAVSR